jgi:hypothetical protein
MGKSWLARGLCFLIRLDKKELDIERTKREYDRSWQSPSNRGQGTGPGILWHTNALGKDPGTASQARICAAWMHKRPGIAFGLSASDKGNEDRQHFVCAT